MLGRSGDADQFWDPTGLFPVEHGELQVRVPLAINATEGEWHIRTDLPVIGKTAEAAVE